MPTTRREFLSQSALFGALAACVLREDWFVRVAAADEKIRGRTAVELASDEDFWIQIQQAFTVDRSMINLNNGGISPTPRIVQEAMRRQLEFTNNSPARNLWTVQTPQIENVRARLARSFGCDPEEMALTRNASEALEICIYGIDLKPGDEVLTTSQDYPRMITTYEQRERRDGIKLVKVPLPTPAPGQAELLAAVESGLTPKTKVILISHVIFLTGQIMPVREIVHLGRQRGIPVIVDGAHAFAHLDFRRDDLDCDYYGTSLHKWTTAPHGTGFLYVRKANIEGLWPLMAAPVAMDKDIRKFEEIGTHPAANKLAIADALMFHEAIGGERKEARLRFLRDRWARRLLADPRVSLYTRLDPDASCAIGTLAIKDVDPAKLVSHLWDKYKIVVVGIDSPPIRGIRISPNVYTTLDEIDTFAAAVEGVLANGLPT